MKATAQIKKIYTKEEIEFINVQGWDFYNKEYSRATNKTEQEKALLNRAKVIRQNINKYFSNRYFDKNISEWYQKHTLRLKAEKKLQREEEYIIMNAVKENSLSSLIFTLRTGEHTGDFTARYSDRNYIHIYENLEQYSRRCSFKKVTRDFTLNIRRGWKVKSVGGIITFWKGDFKREGMPCEWIMQGKAINSLVTVKGFLVRGEHIIAKSLKEAKKISEKHREEMLKQQLQARQKQQERRIKTEDGSLIVTFQDSLKSGNCIFGTTEFKNKYKEATGMDTDRITVKELRKYAKQFGVEYYAERAIRYAISK